jgi:hypothetical protein
VSYLVGSKRITGQFEVFLEYGNSSFSVGAFDLVKVVRMEGEIRNVYKIVIHKHEMKIPVGSLSHK